MVHPSQKMASSLRLFTRGGREGTFATTLVEDAYTRPLRSLVDTGFLTMEYTGTRRVYTLTERGRDYLEGKKMSRKKIAAPPAETPATNGHATEAPILDPKPAAPRRKPRDEEPPAPRPEGPMTALDVIRLMREVRDYADAHEGVDELLGMIRRVEELGSRFGGLDCVRESLQAIREFRNEK